MIKRILSVAFLFVSALSFAQNPYYRIFNAREGLAGTDFFDIKQDSRGNLWIAGNQGLTKYDGYKFENFTIDEGLEDESISHLFIRRNDRIWMCSSGGKVFYKQSDTIKPLIANSIIARFIPQRSEVSSFAVDRGDTIWLGLNNASYILKLIPQSGLYAVKKIDSKFNSYVKLFESGQIIFSGEKNNSKKENCLIELPNGKTVLIDTKNVRKATSIRYDQKLLLSLNNKLYQFSEEGQLKLLITAADDFEQVYTDKENDLWFAYAEEGLALVKGLFTNKPSYNFFVRNIDITHVYQDFEGGIWCSTLGNGLYYFNSKQISLLDIRSGLKNEKITNTLKLSDGTILAGSQEGYLFVLSESNGSVSPAIRIDSVNLNLNNVSLNPVNKIFQSKDNYIWVATLHATYRISPDLKEIISLNYHGRRLQGISSFAQTADSVIWLGGNENLIRASNSKHHVFLDDVDIHFKINALEIDSKGHLWLGTNAGLWHFNERYFKFFGFKNKYLKGKITDIAFDDLGRLWITSNNMGTMVIDGDKIFNFTRINGLIDNHCNSLFVSKDKSVWVSTRSGISNIVFRNNKLTIRSFSSRNGLPADDIFSVNQPDDRIWVNTPKGIVLIDNFSAIPTNYLPRTWINSFTVNDNDLPPKVHYHFKPDENNLEIRFSASSFKNAGKTKYRYKLEGADEHWNVTTANFIRYPDLHPGIFRFIVQAENSNGKWGKDNYQLSFVIETPFWKRWWFIALYTLIGACVLTYVFWLRIRTKHRKELERAEITRKLINLELQALRAQMNPHFIFNCINSIQHFILNSDNDEAHKYLSKFAKLMRNVLDNSKTPVISLEKEIQTLELYMQLESLRFEEKFDYKVEIDPKIDLHYVEIPSMLIQPYIENSIWHGLMHKRGRGQIVVKLEQQEHHIKCIVEDNGIGREKAKEFKSKNKVTHKSVGMMITKERLEILNKVNKSDLSIKIIDKKDKDNNPCGTRVEIFVPI